MEASFLCKHMHVATSDSYFLTIMLLYCCHVLLYIADKTSNKLNVSPVECSYIKSLKAGITSMINGNIVKEKTIVLDYTSSLLSYSQVENKLNCFGSEFIALAPSSCYLSMSRRSKLNSYPYYCS